MVLPSRLSEGEAAELERHMAGRPVVHLSPEQLAAGDVGSAVDAVQRGGFALFLPTPTEAWPGTWSEVPADQRRAVLALGLPVLPVLVDHPGETGLPIDDGASQPQAVVGVGEVIPAAAVSAARYLEAMLAVGEEIFATRAIFDGHLGLAILRGIRRFGGRVGVLDGTDESYLSYYQILAVALALAEVIKKETTKPRIGIVLPPGKAGIIANVAAVLAGKVPVNLNFTAGKSAVESALRQAEVDRILTVDLVVRKMQEFPWPPMKQLILIERLLPQLKSRAVRWGLLAKILPPTLLAKMIGLPKEGGDREATLLFTSGSSGEPKGVVLSHRNLLSNVTQFGARISLRSGDKALGCLPLFHSFGCTVTLWYVLVEGIGLVTYPSPMEVPKLAGLIEKHGVSLLLSTPTFLRGYLRKAKREQLATLKLIVTGAEKLPASVAESFHTTFGKDVMEGYGLTETSPATNFNLPNRSDSAVPSHRPGSVGQLVPGLAIRLTDPVAGGPLPLDHTGIIWFKGSNIFPGYLKQPRKTEEVLQDGWFRTGDIGRMDEDGFLYIEGRLSRFSKIGGEMVPHETVEEHVTRALGLEGESERKVVVVGVPDPDKGEALILLSTVAGETITQELIQLRYAMLDRGVPSLWIPKKMLRVPEIPLLASGKLDLKKCEEIARQTVGL